MDSNDKTDATTCPVSVVVIGKNEEQFIGMCLSSVLAAVSEYPGAEVIYVDSNSSDRTIEIASQFPIQIYQLRKEWKHTPSAGRFIGFRHCRGTYLFFVDGDSKVESAWLQQGINFLESHPDHGGTAGVLHEAYIAPDGQRLGGVENFFGQDLDRESMPFTVLGGSALYRRQAVADAGSFNPYLPTGEEAELAIRIRRSGWKLARINSHMSTKHTEDRHTFHEVFRRLHTSFYDYGTVIRYAQLYGAGWQYAVEMIPYIVTFFFASLAGLTMFGVAVYFGKLDYFAMGIVLMFFLLAAKKGGVRAACLTLAVRTVSTYRTLRSLLLTKIRRIEDYPTDAIRIR
jgi:glycosyltransferase involved in cell wall biosynthesis